MTPLALLGLAALAAAAEDVDHLQVNLLQGKVHLERDQAQNATVESSDDATGRSLMGQLPRISGCVASERLVFLHIPKTSGTAIENAALEQMGVRWGRMMDFDECVVTAKGKCKVQWHEPPVLMKPVNVYTTAKVFCVSRNPYERALSEFRFMVASPNFRWEYSDLIEAKGCEALNEWLSRALEKLLDGHMYEQLCHLMPQSDYIWAPPDAWGIKWQYCDEILRLEDFPASFDKLMRRYEYNISLEGFTNVGECPGLTIRNISRANRELLRYAYARDFRLLNYSDMIDD